MGLKNFIKRHAGIGKLPDSKLNKNTVINILSNGTATFIVTLPTIETINTRGGYAISTSQGGFTHTSYTPAQYKKVFRRVSAKVQYSFDKITILHANENGQHSFVFYGEIGTVGKLGDGIIIELKDGRQYQFFMNNDIKNQWKTLGFNPQYVIDIFYQLISNGIQNHRLNYKPEVPMPQQTNEEKEETPQDKPKKHEKTLKEKIDEMDESAKHKIDLNLEIPCPFCGKMIKTKSIRCKYCKLSLKDYKLSTDYSEAIKKAKSKKTRNIGFVEQPIEEDLKLDEDNLDPDDEKAINDLFNIG